MTKSRREEQVDELLATRERQVERALKIEQLLEPIEHDPDFGPYSEGRELRTHHGWGVCVKVRDVYCDCDWDEPGRRVCTCGLDLAREIFWNDVEHIASEYDFTIHCGGRGGGYVVVSNMPSLDDIYPSERMTFFRERLAPFVLDVREYLAEARALFHEGKLVTGETIAEALDY